MQLALDGVPFLLKNPQAFSWLSTYGHVIKVFDKLTSGNLCFVMDGPYGRLFIKYAGAETINYGGRVRDAVKTLKSAMPLYTPPRAHLTELLAHGATGEGYAAVFRFKEGEALSGMGVKEHVRELPLVVRLRMLDDIFSLIADLAEDGLLSVDVSEANVLISFLTGTATLCDIDLFRMCPSVNDLGRMPGSPYLLAPEEYKPGAVLDHATDVYHMGALAFMLLSDRSDRAASGWQASRDLYQAALKAVSEERLRRYASPRRFLKQWRNAVAFYRPR